MEEGKWIHEGCRGELLPVKGQPGSYQCMRCAAVLVFAVDPLNSKEFLGQRKEVIDTEEDESLTELPESVPVSECEICFVCWQDLEEKKLCDFCSSRPQIVNDHEMRIERMLEVMNRAKVSRFPEMLKIILSRVVWKK